MLETEKPSSISAFCARVSRLDQSLQDVEFLRLREWLRRRAEEFPDLVRETLQTQLQPALKDSRAGLRISFELLRAGLERDGESRFSAALETALSEGLEGLVAVGCEEWADWLALHGEWRRADALYANAQTRHRALDRAAKAVDLYPARARALTHCVDADQLEAIVGEWRSERLPHEVLLALILTLAHNAINADRLASADRHIAAAEARARAAHDGRGACLTRTARASWYWRHGAFARARQEFAAAEAGFLELGAAWEAGLVAANLFSLGLMVQDPAFNAAERVRFESLRQRLRRKDLSAWWQLSLDLAVAAEREGDIVEAVRIYSQLEVEPPSRPNEAKLAGLNFARLRVRQGFFEGLAEDLDEARNDPEVCARPYLRSVAFETSGMYAERLGRLREAAAFLDEAIRSLEAWRRAASTEFFRVSLRAARQSLFERREAVALTARDFESAWRTADSARAAVFTDLLTSALPPLDRAGLRGILRQRASLGRALRASAADKVAVSRAEVLLDRAVSEAPRAQTREVPSTSSSKRRPPSNNCLVYSVTSQGLGAYATRDGRVEHRQLLDAESAASLFGVVAQWWRSRPADSKGDEDEWRATTGRWAATLIEPLADSLAGAGELAIIPCDALALIPWPGLWVASRAKYLDEMFPSGVHLLPSSSMGAMLGASAAVAAPGEIACVSASMDLIYADIEADLIEEAVGTGIRRFGPREARPWRLRRLAPRARWLHLIGHGEFRADLPMGSAVLLQGGDRWTGWDLATCRMPGTTVVLSACTLGGVQDLPGGEWFGLLRGFFLAGARSVVAPIWPVHDLLTMIQMAVFYQGVVVAGVPLAAALRTARQTARAWGMAARRGPGALPLEAEALLERAFAHWRKATIPGRRANARQLASQRAEMSEDLQELAHPRHWSAFQVYGDPAGTALGG